MNKFFESISSFLPMVAIFAALYFFTIRPQQKKAQDHAKLLEGLKVNDRVVTGCGLVGVVKKIEEDKTLGNMVVIDTGNGTEITFLRARINQILKD